MFLGISLSLQECLFHLVVASVDIVAVLAVVLDPVLLLFSAFSA